MPSRELSSNSSSRLSSSEYYPSSTKSSSQGNWSSSEYYPSSAKSSSQAEKDLKPSGSTNKSSSHRTSSEPKKVVIDYPSTYQDPDRRRKYQDSSYLP